MITERLKKNMMNHNMFNSIDIENAVDFVSELCDSVAEEIETNEPYAHVTIREFREAAYNVFSMLQMSEVQDAIDELANYDFWRD